MAKIYAVFTSINCYIGRCSDEHSMITEYKQSTPPHSDSQDYANGVYVICTASFNFIINNNITYLSTAPHQNFASILLIEMPSYFNVFDVRNLHCNTLLTLRFVGDFNILCRANSFTYYTDKISSRKNVLARSFRYIILFYFRTIE